MLHDRNNRFGTVVLTGALALVVTSGCSPDAPEGGLPTHPTDTYSVTLEWDAPTTDAVGQPLDDLAGYRLYYTHSDEGMGAGAEMVEVGDTTRVTVNRLLSGSYLFAVTAIDSDGNESDFSDPLPVEVGP